ncbi:acyl-CoA dehydrogenase family protein [Actinomycetes bacterium M1A6_2h]
MDDGLGYPTSEQEAIRSTARAFFEKVAPLSVMTELDATAQYPAEILSRMADIGLWGLAIDEEYGGNPVDHVTRCLAAEEVQRAGAALGYAWIPTALFCADALRLYGTTRQRDSMLPKIACGDLRMAMSLTEPEAGSDLMSLKTKAVRTPSGYLISGQKVFTTGADNADYILALVRTDPGARPRSALSFFFVPRDAPGVSISPLPKMMGQATHTCEVFLHDVAVTEEDRLGAEGQGAEIMFRLMEADRVYTAAQSVGLAQYALDIASEYATQRIQFGKPIAKHQAVAHMLADMDIAVEASRALTLAAARRLDLGLTCNRESAIAKVHASETGSLCARHGVQILGGYGVMVEYGMERLYRESKIQEIFGGTNQILRDIIGASVAKRR